MTTLAARGIARYIEAIHWFIPIEAQHEAAVLTRAQNVINAVVMAALSGPFYAAAYFALGFTAAAQEILLCCAFMFTAPFLMRATGSIVLAREVFLCAVFFNFTWLTFNLGGVNAPTVGWLITGPVVAMFLGGVSTAVFWLIMSCTAVAAIYTLPLFGIALPDHPVKDMALLYLLCDLGLYIVVVVFVLLFELTKTQGFIKLEQALKIINELAIRDELTGSHNRRHLIKLIESEKERTARLGSLFCLCLLDIDYFKRINDTYGHTAGDMVLKEFATTVQRQIRESDSFGRYGGEEFLLMLPQTSLDEAIVLAERVRISIEKMMFGDIARDLTVTVSIGVAEFRFGESIGQTVARADEALYQAKSGGRNRVVSYGEQTEVAPVLATAEAERLGPPTLPALRVFQAAQSDPLTGALNRSMLRDRLSHAMERAIRNNRLVALMLLNVNKFKEINDAFGYEAGDAILIRAAAMVRSALRESDTIARWGGDEFVVVLEDLVAESDAQQVAEKILDQFAMPFGVGDSECFVTLSIGIATYPGEDCDMDTLLKRADVAMVGAKAWGQNHVQTYTLATNIAPSERLALKNGLREALGAGQLFLEYQPQVDIATQQIIGVEALIRWQHPVYGRIEPSRFIALAEETGMIVPIGEWVLRSACIQNQQWRKAGLPPVKTAVNLSARQLKEPNLIDRIMQIVRETGIEPACLDLEITEGILIDNLELNHATMTRLRAHGLQISIDDFGTGYSSLNYLAELPADVLKMDGSFIKRLGQNAGGARSFAIAEAIIEMAHRLQLKVIAEAVETAEQLADLERMGCDAAQGYFFNRSMHPDKVRALLVLQAEQPAIPHSSVVQCKEST
ncbi:diguanylate cyclase [Massilia sp. R2A-15]|uniref:putative bifunctional diguanylate cyclase/phosphodiesterase n=1 Tax=Massilia sp. R2A-15 TaxID=3064278 RepID=UPI0027365379|nr:diguanylate cyclase [Massilia sp. R2A-15]WLI87695.1 diguanylate cyclase [Massilia sp. R2A-15]